MKRCDLCNKPFKNTHGVSVHKLRSSCGGAGAHDPWKNPPLATRRTVGANGESGKEAIREILKDHPQGLEIAEIRSQLEVRGFKKLNTNYVSQAATSEADIVRVGRGKYRLKRHNNRLNDKKTTPSVTNPISTDMPREVLLLRIETLESQNRALHDAHLSLLRGILV